MFNGSNIYTVVRKTYRRLNICRNNLVITTMKEVMIAIVVMCYYDLILMFRIQKKGRK